MVAVRLLHSMSKSPIVFVWTNILHSGLNCARALRNAPELDCIVARTPGINEAEVLKSRYAD
jgi:hypothetical protein